MNYVLHKAHKKIFTKLTGSFIEKNLYKFGEVIPTTWLNAVFGSAQMTTPMVKPFRRILLGYPVGNGGEAFFLRPPPQAGSGPPAVRQDQGRASRRQQGLCPTRPLLRRAAPLNCLFLSHSL